MSFFSRIASRLHTDNFKSVSKANDEEKWLNAPLLEALPDEELSRLNELLPWSAFIFDSSGRIFGAPYSSSKRNIAQAIPDYRTVRLEEEFGLQGRSVLEAGCFEGLHTIGLAQHGADVTAFDGRIENVVKTLVRCNFFDVQANVQFWNVEHPMPTQLRNSYDILHHVGVLYHLSDPIAHLNEILPFIKDAVLLDTHVADELPMQTETSHGVEYRYANFKESGREPPFAGLTQTARWIHSEDLLKVLRKAGFINASIIETRTERNGKRVCIIATKN